MGQITAIIPTSNIPSHPSTAILERTVASVRGHIPGVRIIVTCDGLRQDHEHRRTQYEEYVSRVSAMFPTIRFDTHTHQSGMMPAALARTETPLILYLEHDWELGHPIEWAAIEDVICAGEANYVKFHAGNRIHPLHEHMMFDRIISHGIPLIKTVQFSANPHVASAEWYRSLEFRFREKTDYIENILHGPIAVAPWETHKLMIYNPVTGDMKRAFHLDGRQDDKP